LVLFCSLATADSKKWSFLATFGEIAISQPKRIQNKINPARIISKS